MSNRSALKVLRAHVQTKADAVVVAITEWDGKLNTEALDKAWTARAAYLEARALLAAAEGTGQEPA